MALDDILTKRADLGYHEEPPAIDAEEFFKVVDSRRSVRTFGPDPIPESVVRRCLDAALKAPNSSNLQQWEMHWVRTPAKKEALVEACLGQPAASTARELVVFVARTGRWREMRERMLATFKERKEPVPKAVLDYYGKLMPLVLDQGPLGLKGLAKGVFLYARGLRKATPREPVNARDMRVWAAKSTALACENYMLAMRASGFDTCPMEGFDGVRVARLLDLPPDAYVTMVISAGKRAKGGVYGPRIRFDASLFVKEH